MGKDFKSLFFKTDSAKDVDESVQQVQVQNTVTVNDSTPVTQISAQQTSISSNPEIVQKIQDVIESKNLPGPDYLELKKIVQSLNNVPLTDDQKLQASFNVLKGQYPNFSKDIILNSIDTYIGIVNDEKKSGLDEVAKVREDKISGTEKLIEKLKMDADNLKKKYDEILHQIDEYTTNVAAERITINNKETMFVASVDTVLNTLQADKSKISTINI